MIVCEELDLKILKSLALNKVNALTFVYKYDASLFDEGIQKFVKLFIDYTKHFRAPPTKRTLTERHKGNELLVNLIDETWEEFSNIEYDINEYPYDLSEIKKRFQIRAAEELREQASSEDPDNPINPEEYFNKLQLSIAKVTSLDLGRGYTQKPVGDYIEEFQNSYETTKLNPEASTRIMTGFSLIDTETGGGKSMALNNMAKQLWLQKNNIEDSFSNISGGNSVLYFSLEMDYRSCFIRFLASLANVPQRDLEYSTLNFEQELRVKRAYEFIKKYQDNGFFFDIVDVPRNLTTEEMELRYHDAMLRYRPDIVVVDYMGLMDHSIMKKDPDWLKQGAISASLHEFGRAYDCVVASAAQLTDLKRNSQSSKIDEHKAVGVHRWGRSSLIMHNVNLAIQIESRMNEINYPDLKIHIVKNRKGPTGKGSLIKNFANASLIDVPFDENEIPGDISANIPELIKSIQQSKNKLNERN
jgi:replicative DNA helicase